MPELNSGGYYTIVLALSMLPNLDSIVRPILQIDPSLGDYRSSGFPLDNAMLLPRRILILRSAACARPKSRRLPYTTVFSTNIMFH